MRHTVTTVLRIALRVGAIALVAPLAMTLGAQAAATPPAAGAAATSAAASSTAPAAARAARQSWTADRRNFAVGDIITVTVDDYTISTAIKDDVNQDQRSRNASIGIRQPGGVSGMNAGVDTRNDGSSTQRGQARRENRFQSEMSMRVVAVGANGLLQVKGTKLINVDKNQQNIVLSGWIRAQDVSGANVVESNRIADAQVAYASPGALGKPKGGIVSKVIGIIWP
jgi:flagellar L-ring protein precursor FlgH